MRTPLARCLLALPLAIVLAGCGNPVSPVTPPPLPVPSPTPVPTATPVALITPTPLPTPTPCTQGLCEEPTTNTNLPVRLTLRIYTIVNGGGELIKGITEKDAIPLSYTVTVDATAKDAVDNDTLGLTPIQWQYENAGGVSIRGNHTHQRRLTGERPGIVLVTATQDGVKSNTVMLQFE